MHQADLVAELRAECRVTVLGGRHIQHLGLGDEGAHPIDLGAGGDRALDAANDLVKSLQRHRAGDDGLPARRLLVEPRHVHVAIARQQQRSRDRRRRHDQQLGAGPGPLGLQRQPLMHAEAVLLVDDHEGQIAELDRLLEQRMGADEDVDVALFQRPKDGVAFAVGP